MSAAGALLLYTLSNTADLASTRYLQARGGRETWIPAQSLGGQAAFKAASTALEVWGDHKLSTSGHRGIARLGRVLILGLNAYAVIHNLRQAGRIR